VSVNQKASAKDLPCLFADLVEKYSEIGLKPCETKESQRWRHASTAETARRLAFYHNHFPELTNLHSSLEFYSFCEKHYNQIVATNQFYQRLIGFAQENKRLRFDIDKDDVTDPANHSGLAVELDNTRRLLKCAQLESRQKSETITNFNNQIVRMQQHLEDQKIELEELKKRLRKAYDDMNELRNLYEEQHERNEALTEQWNLRFANKQKRVDAIIEIAKAERMSFYDDVESLIRNNHRFSIENLMTYTPSKWLNGRNQVIVKFVETLIRNNRNTDTRLSEEKLFKVAVAVDSICAARHGKYVSEINLAVSAIKYSIARSKKIINIDNHMTSAGSYYRFQTWLEELSSHEEPLPEGLLFLAFDNEQRGQKNYLDRGFNTLIYHIVTSFVAFNMASQNKIQHTDSPWAYSLDRLQYEELFDISPPMQEVIDKELYIYLTEILDLLSEEKSSSTNVIDSLITSTATNINSMKECPSCNQQNIENRKQVCPTCGMRLPTLGEIQKGKAVESEISTTDRLILTKPLIFKPYSIVNNDDPCVTSVPISLTQRSVIDQRVNIPEIYIPDPININPNSIANVEKVLLHIEKISGIKDGTRKWIAVACDGVPYHHATKLKEKFPWLVLIPGQLHEEMNMLRAYVELNW